MNNKGFSEEIKRKCIPIFSRNKNVTIIKKKMALFFRHLKHYQL